MKGSLGFGCCLKLQIKKTAVDVCLYGGWQIKRD